MKEKDKIVQLAEDYICNTGVSVFLTGKAGTGKTTFLRHIVESTAKRLVVLAPTGVAAVNAGGVTIHSFFQLPLCPYLPDVKELVTEYQMPEAKRQLRKEKLEIIRTLDLIVIDEISMVRADLLDAMDDVLRKVRHDPRPFGGVQMLMIGDLQQLPPVLKDNERPYFQQVYTSPFFFDAKAMTRLKYVTIELQTIYRQQDADFVRVLNNVRDGHFDAYTSQALANRLDTGFEPPMNDSSWIRLCTHNATADRINMSRLSELKSREYIFDAKLDGQFPENNAPADVHLRLKEGAQVMFIRNDSQGQYYNGKTGIITGIDARDGITVTDSDGTEISVEMEKWENVKYEIDSTDNEIKPIVQGTFTQYPLRLAWAITIHKSQGLTFDRVMIDAASAFSFGQVYVALSRCRTLDGIVLTSPISSSCVFGNESVSGFCHAIPDVSVVENALDAEQRAYYFNQLKECFDLRPLRICTERVERIFLNDVRKILPKQTEKFTELGERILQLCQVSEKFCTQIDRIAENNGNNTDDGYLHERIGKAAEYFSSNMGDILAEIAPMLTIETDNKDTNRRLRDTGSELLSEAGIHLQGITKLQTEKFSVESYHRSRVDAILTSSKASKGTKGSHKRQAAKDADIPYKSDHDIYDENNHPELVEALIEWRKVQYRKNEVPAYFILSQKTLLNIADAAPRNRKELMSIIGFGKTKWEQYGEELLELIADNVIRG
ncbi:MAG: AAA family ATPase [Bacteroidaceae bacterium]|nr:AAA family ATPase [Bacteroidaceae bacterium]